MFRKLLIANRGEIAIRIARTCREMGIAPVGVYSEADRSALHRRHMEESYEVGPAPASESYLSIDRILAVAKKSNAEAVHPGYGFLSESPEFSRRCSEAGLIFIGPGPDAMSKSGDKLGAKAAMESAGLPVTPGSGAVRSEEDAIAAAKAIGLPVILKAAGGGGGIGMTVVHRQNEVAPAFRIASSTLLAAFGDPTLFVEKFHRHPRHIEAQVVVDRHGSAVFLGERECSIQRRHQKVVEEAPSPVVGPKTRKKLGEMATRAMKAIGYVNAGTVEFLLSGGKLYFNEINARLQVEHTVTEMVTGLDLVCEQIRVAAGEPLSVSQKEVEVRGHAIECRINAEDPTANFAPSPGTVTRYHEPGGPGVRVDSGIAQGSHILGFYDPLVAKLAVHGRSRGEAIARMSRATREFVIEGVATILPLHQRILEDEAFRAGELSTAFLEERGLLTVLAAEREEEVAAIAAAIATRPSLAAHLRQPLTLAPASASKWTTAGRPRAGGEPHATAPRGRWKGA